VSVMPRGRSQSIRVLLTVPHLQSTASPYREMMAVARYLPRPEFSLTICSLRQDGYETTAPLLRALGAEVFVARFRTRGKTMGHLRSCLKDQKLISARGSFDIQHSLDFSSAPVEAVLAKLYGRRFMFSQRNLNEGGNLALLRIKCGLAKRVVAISRAVRALLEALKVRGERIVEIALGIEESVDAGDRLGDLPVRGRFLLSVGHIEPRKRHEDGIEAFARIAPELPDLSFLIAGRVVDPGYAASLKSLVLQRGLRERVHFLGLRKDVMSLMRRAECLIHWPESEAFGWVILEAMVVGLPVVGSSVGGIKEVIEDGKTGTLISVGDTEGGAAAIAQVLNDRERTRSLVLEASRIVRERYSAVVMVSRLAELYRNICAERRT
jgi:glycosyltransferase involved in cell wall biosynthesis